MSGADERVLRVRLLGEFQLLFGDETVVGLNADRPQSLLAFLLLHRHAPQPRRHLAFLLWPDSSESQARTNLRNLLHTLRRTLPEADTYLAIDSLTLQWQPDAPFELDVAAFEAAWQAARRATDVVEQRAHLETAVALYGGELLPGNYDEWALSRREELRQNYLEALSRLISLLTDAGDWRAAVRFARRLVLEDPLDEAAAVQLMRLHALSGDRAGVRRAFQTLTSTLQRELGVEAAPATVAAYETLLRQEAGAAPEGVATTALERIADTVAPPRPPDLPIPATPFVGREVELAAIAEHLADPDCRLLTIIGPGGMGKTRLALQTATGHQSVFEDGVAYIPLSTLQSADLLLPTTTSALNLSHGAGADPLEQLVRFLAQREMLLVYDNFEHIVDGAGLLSEILSRTTGCKIVVTSRQRLALHGEWVFELHELPVPEDVGTAVDNSAVALFVQSARRANSAYSLAESDVPHVIRACQLVGGMPLAIELAASWVRLLTCAEIARELAQGLDLLDVARRDIPERHHNIRAVFDHSWDLLGVEERRVFQAFSVFSGGFTRCAAERVAGAGLNTLSSLVDKSLLRRTRSGRYTLHELVRQYAAAHLARDETAAANARRQHAHYYLTLVADHEDRLFSPGQKLALDEMTAEIDNIRRGVWWALDQRAWGLLRGAVRALGTFFEYRSWLPQGLALFEEVTAALQAKADEADDDFQVLAGFTRVYLAWFTFHSGRADDAVAMFQQAAARAPDELEWRIRREALQSVGLAAYVNGDYRVADRALAEAIELNRAHDDNWSQAFCVAMTGMIAYIYGEFATAHERLSQAVQLWRQIGDPRIGQFNLSCLGLTALALNHLDEAEAALEEGLELATANGDRFGLSTVLFGLGSLALAQGDLARAERIAGESMALTVEMGDRWGEARSALLLGVICQTAGAHDQAEKHYRAAHATANGAQAYPYAQEALIRLAELYNERGEPARARRTALAVRDHPASSPIIQNRVDALLVQLESGAPAAAAPAGAADDTWEAAPRRRRTALAPATARR